MPVFFLPPLLCGSEVCPEGALCPESFSVQHWWPRGAEPLAPQGSFSCLGITNCERGVVGMGVCCGVLIGWRGGCFGNAAWIPIALVHDT